MQKIIQAMDDNLSILLWNHKTIESEKWAYILKVI